MARKLSKQQQEKLRKEIEENVYIYADVSSALEGTLQEVAARILAFEERIKQEWAPYKNAPENTYIKFRMGIESGEYPEFFFKAVRMETDKEYNDRLERNKKASKAAKEAAKKREENLKEKELAELKRLQDKYGKIKV
jgi:hypothetical protein